MASNFASQSSPDMCADASWPTRRLWGSATYVPDFARIPQEQWRAAMISTPSHLRFAAVQGVALPVSQAGELVELAMSELPPAPTDLARAAVKARPELQPTPPRERHRRADRQVNFRLTHGEYVDLATMAELMGWSPTALAGELVRVGVRRMMEEANRPDG